ncbi:hypothetical protein PHYBOEH_011152 [Phytophthora boehmeriae]|uniref:Uncharacterized protein n=1 Tax=Phytophthora boehmeriae TaxID=109152 RepID=A0A8T1VJU4_9STRA|nr:hypothetical protein PHYBOEH_011152 [Phytophthora boehmeriae]
MAASESNTQAAERVETPIPSYLATPDAEESSSQVSAGSGANNESASVSSNGNGEQKDDGSGDNHSGQGEWLRYRFQALFRPPKSRLWIRCSKLQQAGKFRLRSMPETDLFAWLGFQLRWRHSMQTQQWKKAMAALKSSRVWSILGSGPG